MTPLAPLPLQPLPERPLVSALVSCYNYRAYVADAVESVLAQGYEPVEVVVVDDGSTDGSGDRVRSQFGSDVRVRLIEQANAGQGAAMNTAVAAANGEVLCFLDADDVFEPEKAARAVDAFRARPGAGFLVHGFTTVDGGGRVLSVETRLPEAGWQGEAVLRRGGAVPAAPPTSALVLRRAVADALFPLDPTFRIAADVLVQRLAPLLTEIAVVPEPLMRYRVHGANHFGAVDQTAEGISRMIEVAEAARERQGAFLRGRFGAEVASRLRPLSDDPGWLGLRVQRAYLDRSPSFEGAARHLAAHPDSASGRAGAVARLAASLPRPLGLGLWGTFYGSGVHKRALRFVRSVLLQLRTS